MCLVDVGRRGSAVRLSQYQDVGPSSYLKVNRASWVDVGQEVCCAVTTTIPGCWSKKLSTCFN